MNTSTFCATSDRLRSWWPLLTQWTVRTEAYCAAVANDAPYWYGEQTNVAYLTGTAFTLPGWLALTEFSMEKGEDGQTRGRADGWFKNSAGEYFIEAKQVWPDLGEDDLNRVVAQGARQAKAAAEDVHLASIRNTTQAEVHGVALLFICPRYRPGMQRWEARLEELLTHAQSLRYDALAWVFPSQTKELWSAQTKRCYPGIILAAWVS